MIYDHDEFIKFRDRLFNMMLDKPKEELQKEIESFNQLMKTDVQRYEQIENYKVLPLVPFHDRRIILSVSCYHGEKVEKNKIYYFKYQCGITWVIEDSEEYDLFTSLDKIS